MRFILLVVLIDMLSVGLIVPVLPSLVGTFTTNAAEQATWYGVIVFAFAISSFVVLADPRRAVRRYGRRPVLLSASAGSRSTSSSPALATALWMLVGVARRRRRDAGERRGRERLRRRHHARPSSARSASAARRDVRHRLHRGPGHRRPARRHQPAPAVLRRRRARARRTSRTAVFVLPESLPVERRRPFSLAPRQSARVAAQPRPAPARGGSSGSTPAPGSRSSCSTRRGCCTRRSVRLGTDRERLVAVRRRARRGAGPGSAARPPAEEASRRGGSRSSVCCRRRRRTSASGSRPQGWMLYVVIVANFLGNAVGAVLQGIVSGAADASRRARRWAR